MVNIRQNFIILIFLILAIQVFAQNLNFQFYTHPDSHLDIVELVTKHGYSIERHDLVTIDNYIITTFRIPHGRNSSTPNTNPVIIVPGMGGSTDNFVVLGPKKALAYILAENGYDVWMMNNRGSYYSRKHKYLNPDVHQKYWDFSWHEIGVIDITENIDYILKKTNQTKLFYIGHSQGSTSYFPMTIIKPEYNNKIKMAVLLVAAAYMSDVDHAIMKLVAKFTFVIERGLKFLNIYEIFPQNHLFNKIIQFICSEITIMTDVCIQVFYGGNRAQNIERTLLSLILRNAPAGFAVKQLIHYFQIIDSGIFRQFDYGPQKNMVIYKSSTPPVYNMTKSTAPVAFFTSYHDFIAPAKAIPRMSKDLPNVVSAIEIPEKYNFQHVDFIFGRNVHTLVYSKILALFMKIGDK